MKALGPMLILVASSMGLASSISVFALALKAKHKDFCNYAILMLIIYDILMDTFGLIGVFGTSRLYCEVTMFFIMYARDCHTILIFFMAYSLYTMIVREKMISIPFIWKTLAFGNLLAICISALVILEGQTSINPGFCILEDGLSNEQLALNLCTFLIPSIIVLVFIVYYYCHIRSKLKVEADICRLSCTKRRIFAKRLLGYCFVYTFYFLPYLVITIIKLIHYSNSNVYYVIEMSSICWYPMFNSLMYGLTKSSRKNLFNICIKNLNYDDEQELLYEMRNEGILQPRFYLDLLDEPESLIFEQSLKNIRV